MYSCRGSWAAPPTPVYAYHYLAVLLSLNISMDERRQLEIRRMTYIFYMME